VRVHRHGCNRLIWLKDLDLLLRQPAPLAWELVEALARGEGVSGSVWYSLLLAKRILASPVPARQLTRVAPAPPVRWLYRRLWPVQRVAALDGTMRRRAVQFHAAESWRGMLPALLLLGRRAKRVRAIGRALSHG